MRKFSILLLLCPLMLCLAACGNQGTTDDDIVGDDWRTWGTVQAAGTIVHGGEETDVLVCLCRDEAVFYYSIVGAASLPYVNAPEAQLLGHDSLDASFIDRHADALVLLFLGPEGGQQ